MLIIAIIGLLVGGAAVGLIAWSAILPRERAAARVNEIDAYGYHAPVPTVEGTPTRPLSDVAQRIGGAIAARMDLGAEEGLRSELVAAGMYETPARVVLGYRVLLAIALGGLLGIGQPLGSPILDVLIAVFGAVLGWRLPLVYVQRRATRRRTEVDLALPNMIDQVVVTMEAGLGFSNAVQLAAEHQRDALGAEMRLALQEQRMGSSLREALEHVLARVDTPNTRSFVRATIQAETLGVSLGTIMRNLAVEMRARRKARAEEQAHKAPVKILFPLVLMIFPSLFIILLGPALYQVGASLGGV
jgi:tight adherence protein C